MTTKKLILIRDVFNMLNGGGGKRETYYQFGNRIFRVVYENSNGAPCGYDYKHCVDVYNVTSDEWHHVINRDYIQNIVTKPMNFSDYFAKSLCLECGQIILLLEQRLQLLSCLTIK